MVSKLSGKHKRNFSLTIKRVIHTFLNLKLLALQMKMIPLTLFSLCLISLYALSPSEALLEGCADICRLYSLHSPLEGHSFQETSERIIYSSGISIHFCNGIFEKDPTSLINEKHIQDMVEYFNQKNVPFLWWTSSPHSRLSTHLQTLDPCTGIVLDLTTFQPNTLSIKTPISIDIRIASSTQELEDFFAIREWMYDLPPTIADQFRLVDLALFDKGLTHYFIAYSEGIPVSILNLCLGQVAGIWSLATLPEYQRQGIATALVHAAIMEAKKHHYTHIMAILNKKQLAKTLFTHLGFDTISPCNYFSYTPYRELP
jgi:GNAT superfamily N-acetyltransferase